jgi:hypothetical protein
MVFQYSLMPQISCNIARAMANGAPSSLLRMSLPNPTPTITVDGKDVCNPINIAQKSALNKNRRLAGCGGKLKCPPVNYNGALVAESCDEYPFASTFADRTNANALCVPVTEQQDQSALIKQFYKQYNIQNNGPFDVEVQGITDMTTDCPFI